MKRFILFGFDNYYPTGGLNDIIGSFDTLNDLREHVRALEAGEIESTEYPGSPEDGWQYYQVLDTFTSQEVPLDA